MRIIIILLTDCYVEGFYYAAVIVCQLTDLPDGRMTPRQMYISGGVLGLARKISSDIPPTPL